MLAGFDKLDAQRCSPRHLQVLRDAAVSRPYVRGIGYWEATERLCGVGFLPQEGLKPSHADRIYDNGFVAWWPSKETEVGGVQLFLIRYGNHDVAIDPRLLLDLGSSPSRQASLWVENLRLSAVPWDAPFPQPALGDDRRQRRSRQRCGAVALHAQRNPAHRRDGARTDRKFLDAPRRAARDRHRARHHDRARLDRHRHAPVAATTRAGDRTQARHRGRADQRVLSAGDGFADIQVRRRRSAGALEEQCGRMDQPERVHSDRREGGHHPGPDAGRDARRGEGPAAYLSKLRRSASTSIFRRTICRTIASARNSKRRSAKPACRRTPSSSRSPNARWSTPIRRAN